MSSGPEHWDAVYGAREEQALSWFEPRPALSLQLIARHARPGGAIVDVGAGASFLADHLVAANQHPVTVLDLSARALARSRDRIGHLPGGRVDWVAADVTRWRPARRYALWHDRAVLHFLTDAPERARYVASMRAALEPGGVAVIATFAEDGPEKCSDLPVRRYSPASLLAELERHAPGAFAPLEARHHLHRTPKGGSQRFQVSVFRMIGAPDPALADTGRLS